MRGARYANSAVLPFWHVVALVELAADLFSLRYCLGISDDGQHTMIPVMCRQYKCASCPHRENKVRKWPAWSDHVLAQLERHGVRVPFTFTERSGVQTGVLKAFMRSATKESEEGFASGLQEKCAEAHMEKVVQYYRRHERNGTPAHEIEPAPSWKSMASAVGPTPSRPYLSELQEHYWEVHRLEELFELLIEAVKTKDVCIDHTFRLCKYIGTERNKGKKLKAFHALLKVMCASTGRYVDFRFTQGTSYEEFGGEWLDNLAKRMSNAIELVYLDNAAGGHRIINERLRPKHALRSIMHIIDLLVMSTVDGHVLRRYFAEALSQIFYTLDPSDVARENKKAMRPLSKRELNARRRQGKVRAYVDGEGLEERFKSQTAKWGRIAEDVEGVALFTPVTTELLGRVEKWIRDGEVADPPGVLMYTNLGSEEQPRYKSRRDTSKLEGSNAKDHAIFQPARVTCQKAHRRMLQHVVMCNTRIERRDMGARDFGHFNYRLLDEGQKLCVALGIEDEQFEGIAVPVGRPKYNLGVKGLRMQAEQLARNAGQSLATLCLDEEDDDEGEGDALGHDEVEAMLSDRGSSDAGGADGGSADGGGGGAATRPVPCPGPFQSTKKAAAMAKRQVKRQADNAAGKPGPQKRLAPKTFKTPPVREPRVDNLSEIGLFNRLVAQEKAGGYHRSAAQRAQEWNLRVIAEEMPGVCTVTEELMKRFEGKVAEHVEAQAHFAELQAKGLGIGQRHRLHTQAPQTQPRLEPTPFRWEDVRGRSVWPACPPSQGELASSAAQPVPPYAGPAQPLPPYAGVAGPAQPLPPYAGPTGPILSQFSYVGDGMGANTHFLAPPHAGMHGGGYMLPAAPMLQQQPVRLPTRRGGRGTPKGCRRCRNHGVDSLIAGGHTKNCPYLSCECKLCKKAV